MESTRRTMLFLFACFALGLVLFLAGVSASRGHEAPTGWSYPYACCSGLDCREVGDAYTPDASIRVLERPEGYVISSTSEVIPMTSTKVRQSPDGLFHWCSEAGKDDSRTICLFVPSRGF